MVFCCIAIVGVALAYWVFLSLRQLFSGPRRDPTSQLPAPPRALTGNLSQPVFGHTGLFRRLGGDIALRFAPDWKEWGYWLPSCCSREIGDCFSVFIWGQWRVVIKGPERCRKILDSPDVKEDWAWSPPVTLLGKSCLLDGEEEEFLQTCLRVPLSQKNVQRYAPQFATAAERYVAELLDPKQQEEQQLVPSPSSKIKSTSDNSSSSSRSISSGSSDSDDNDCDEGNNNATLQDSDHSSTETMTICKVKWKALRAYTLDLVDGPVLGMNCLHQPRAASSDKKATSGTSSEISVLGKSTKPSIATDEATAAAAKNDERLQKHKSNLLLWMERLKRALCVIKVAMGPEWMYLWIMSEYGRAVNARMHLTKILAKHVGKRVEASGQGIKHKSGQVVRDPLAMPIPIWAFAERVFRRNENVVGQEGIPRQRTLSEGHTAVADELNRLYGKNDNGDIFDKDSSVSSSDDDDDEQSLTPASHVTSVPSIPEPDALMRDGSIHSRRTLATGRVIKEGEDSITFVFQHREQPPSSPTSNRTRSFSEPCAFPDRTLHPKVIPNNTTTTQDVPTPEKTKTATSAKPTTILDLLLRQQDQNGSGLTQAVTTEVCILLWMMMDVGNAWTAMALKLLSLDHEACHRIQLELDQLAATYGKNQLCTAAVMKQMVTLDALLYEAIRLCPPFLGGMKKTKKTVEFQDCQLQIPKNTHVIFCQPSIRGFDLSQAMGKKPERLGKAYPSPELHGFLPYKGLEVPLMVLQSKVFLAVLLIRCSPHMTKKRTIVQKVSERLKRRTHQPKMDDPDDGAVCTTDPQESRGDSDHYARFEDEHSSHHHHDYEAMQDSSFSSVKAESTDDNTFNPYLMTPSSLELGDWRPSGNIASSQTYYMELFDKIPFPEPRRVINVRERESVLELLGNVTEAGIANVV